MSESMRRGAGLTAATFALLWALAAPAIYWYWVSNKIPGVTIGLRSGEHLVLSVPPGSNGAEAGLAVGDRIDVESLGIADRYRLNHGWNDGRVVHVRVVGKGGTRIAELHHGGSYDWNAPVWIAPIACTVSALIAAIVLWRRPSVMTAAFAWYCLFGPMGRSPLTYALSGLPDIVFAPLAVLVDAFLGVMPILALLPFIARFPSGAPTPQLLPLTRVVDAIFVLSALLFVWRSAVVSPFDTDTWSKWVEAIAGILVVAWCSGLYATSSGDQRRRIGWVLTGLGVTACAYAVYELVLTAHSPALLIVIVVMGQTAFPISVAYGILRHRVIDLGFALNRSLVFGVVTGIVVLVLSFVDWLAGRFISETRLALAVEAAVAVGFGVALNWVHGWVETVIDRFFFRERHRAEAQLELRIAALDFATAAEAVDSALVDDAARILRLGSAAVFRVGEWDGYRRTSSVGWSDSQTRVLEANDLLIRTILAGEGTLILEDLDLMRPEFPTAKARPDIALPIVLRHQLVGIALYGRRDGDVILDPEERHLLERLARAGATAYDAIEAARWRRQALAQRSFPLPIP